NPRALNEPVGFRPSSLITTFSNSRLRNIGVKPSPSVTGSASGSTAAYHHIEHGAPASDCRVNLLRSAGRSYRTKRTPPSAGQTVRGSSSDSFCPHREHSKYAIRAIGQRV